MPRRPTRTKEGIPLSLVPHVMMQGVRKYREEVEWMEAQKTNHHFYSVSIRMRPVKTELKHRRGGATPSARVCGAEDGERA
jgi:hypothetical protein